MAGYSGTALERKLGIRPGSTLALISMPAEFAENLELPPDVTVRHAARGRLDVVVFFATRRSELDRRFPAFKRALEPSGGLWIAWPKRASRVATDLSEGTVRAVGLTNGLVDNKVAAIDDVWSGLRFVYRVADRPR